MDEFSASTDRSSLENSAEGFSTSHDLNSTCFDINDYINFGDMTYSERSVCADGSCVDPCNNQNDQSMAWGIFDQLETGTADALCKRTTLDGKYDSTNCPVCSKKSLEKDLREIFPFDSPDPAHVFAFHMPPDEVSEQMDANSFCNDLSMFHVSPTSLKDGDRPVDCDFPYHKSPKRRRIRGKSPAPMALLKEILESGGTLSPELLAKVRKSVDKEERYVGGTLTPPRQREKNNSSSGCNGGRLPLPIMGDSPGKSSSYRQGGGMLSSSSRVCPPFLGHGLLDNELQRYRPCTDFANSSANYPLFTNSSTEINENPSSDFNFVAISEPRTAFSMPSLASARSHYGTTSNTRLEGVQATRPSSNTLYQCTFKCYNNTFPTKSEWKRHEESFHKQRYMCKECCAGLAYPPNGYTCGVCMEGHFADLTEVKIHTIQCKEAQQVGKSFTRKDNLRTHLRDGHDQLVFSDDDLDWVFDVDSDWPRECGFCGDILNDWDLRADHIEVHFKAGKRISAWKIPFRRSAETKHVRRGHDRSDDDDDEEDDDSYFGYDDSRGSGAIKDFGQSYSGTERSDNQTISSTTFGNYRKHSQAPTQGQVETVHCDGDSSNEDIRSDSVSTRTIVGVPAPTSCLGKPSRPKTQTNSVCLEIYSPLERYLSELQQHELLLLGHSRKPLNIIIGRSNHQESSTFLQNPHRIAPTPNINSPQHAREPNTETESYTLSKDLDPPTPLHVPTIVRKYIYDSISFDTTAINDRIRILYLENREQPCIPGYRDRTIVAVDETAVKVQLSFPQIARNGTISTRSSYTKKHSQSTISTTASTLASVASTIQAAPAILAPPPWQPLTLNQQLSATPWNYAYELPCEFSVIGCFCSFHPTQFEAWIAHTASHFAGNLPPKAICTFCDDQDSIFENSNDLQLNWRTRMLHIGGHLQNFVQSESVRPDYFVLAHLWKNGHVSSEDYNDAISFTERPTCSGLVPFSYETPEMKRQAEWNSRQFHDLDDEDRRRRKAKRKGKWTHKPRGIEHNQLESNKLEMRDVQHRRNNQPLSQTRMTSTALGPQTEREERQGESYKRSVHDDFLELRNLINQPRRPSNKIHAVAPEEHPSKANTLPIEAHLSNSDDTASKSRSRSTASSQSQLEASGTTELTSHSRSDGQSQTGSKHLQTLQENSLLSDNFYVSNLIPDLVPHFNLLHTQFATDSIYLSTLRRGYEESSIHSPGSFSGLRTLHDSTSSSGNRVSENSRDECVERKYRVPDNANKYITSTFRGAVKVINHRTASYDPVEPSASDATNWDYKMTGYARR